jgi:CheY-like chemotaxis protein
MSLSCKNTNVLVVDDDDFFRDFLADVLRSNNYHVVDSDSRENAFSYFKENHQLISFVIMDIIMPGNLTVVDFYSQMLAINKQIRYLAVTAGCEETEIEHLNCLGCPIITKPIQSKQFINTLSNMSCSLKHVG